MNLHNIIQLCFRILLDIITFMYDKNKSVNSLTVGY